MRKKDFLSKLRRGLSGLPREAIEERLTFYSEMIDDRIEEGLTEEEAVARTGPAEDVIAQILSESAPPKPEKSGRALRIWEIVLLILGSPIWLSLLAAALILVLGVYVTVWAVDAALWAADLGFACGFLSGIVSSGFFWMKGNVLPGIATAGAGLACAGLAILAFFGCVQTTRGILILTKKLYDSMKSLFAGKKEKK